MSDQKSQEGSGSKSYNNIGELLQEAVERTADEPKGDLPKEEKKGKGLEFMAYKLSVARKHIELSVTKKITPVESNLLRLLEIGTIGAQNSRSHICSKAEFFISDLSKALGYKEKDKIWKVLKSLEAKKYIIREKTRSKDREILGLNPKVFDQILIDKHHEIDKKRHLKLVPNNPVDNNEPEVDKSTDESSGAPTNRMCSTDEPSGDNRRSVGTEPTNRLCSDSQVSDNRPQNGLLDSSRFILDSFRGQNQEEETNVSLGGTGEVSNHAPEYARMIREHIKQVKL